MLPPPHDTAKCPCGQPAVWVYEPASQGPAPLRCDACVPRGNCACLQRPAFEMLSIHAQECGLPQPPLVPWLHYARDRDGRFSVCVDWSRLDAHFAPVQP